MTRLHVPCAACPSPVTEAYTRRDGSTGASCPRCHLEQPDPVRIRRIAKDTPALRAQQAAVLGRPVVPPPPKPAPPPPRPGLQAARAVRAVAKRAKRASAGATSATVLAAVPTTWTSLRDVAATLADAVDYNVVGATLSWLYGKGQVERRAPEPGEVADTRIRWLWRRRSTQVAA